MSTTLDYASNWLRKRMKARYAEKPLDIEIASPMRVEVALPTFFGTTSLLPGRVYREQLTETRQFVCDLVRVECLKVARRTDKEGYAVISFEPRVSNGGPQRKVRIQLEVLAGKETLLTAETCFVAETGNASKAETAKLMLDQIAWKATFAEGRAPVVRMTLWVEEPAARTKGRLDSRHGP